MSDLVKKYKAYGDAYVLTRQAIITTKQAIATGGPAAEIRELDIQLLTLDERARQLWGRMMAVRARRAEVRMPTDAEIAAIGNLLEETEILRRRAVATSDALQLGARVLKIAGTMAQGAAA